MITASEIMIRIKILMSEGSNNATIATLPGDPTVLSFKFVACRGRTILRRCRRSRSAAPRYATPRHAMREAASSVNAAASAMVDGQPGESGQRTSFNRLSLTDA